MTTEEILKMPAGQELDELVAEQVMGWHKDKDHWVDKDNRYMHGVGRYYGFEDYGEKFHVLNWHPSESILWAWEVADKSDLFNLNCPRLYDQIIWTCTIAINNSFASDAEAETAPLAICRAALLAVMG